MQLTYYNVWNDKNYQKFLDELVTLCDSKYLAFNKSIVFTKYKMLGIRVPIMRSLAKDISKTDFRTFLNCNFKGVYEELFMHGVLLSYIKDYDEFILYFDKFIELIDNWAICDMCLSSYKIINKNKEKFFDKIKEYLSSDKEYIIRVGIIALLDYYLIDEYVDRVIELISNINYHTYYIDMATSWLISVSFVKYQNKTIAFLDNNNLSETIINMTIQKIRDSKRVDKSMKDYVLKYKKRLVELND